MEGTASKRGDNMTQSTVNVLVPLPVVRGVIQFTCGVDASSSFEPFIVDAVYFVHARRCGALGAGDVEFRLRRCGSWQRCLR